MMPKGVVFAFLAKHISHNEREGVVCAGGGGGGEITCIVQGALSEP